MHPRGSDPVVVLDRERRVVALLAGRPRDPSWDSVVEEADRAMGVAARTCRFTEEQHNHRRGTFATLARGLSFGGGRKVPGYVVNTKRNEGALKALCQNNAMGRIAGFGSNMLATYAPLAHANMSSKLRQLNAQHPSIHFNFGCSIFPAASFNFGPSAVCFPHADAANDPCNWCHIVPFGQFDPKKGGQLVIFEAKLVIEFPPGSNALLPSAIFTHANVPIQPHEQRQSFTQYCAGGLLRWVECGFRTVGTFKACDPIGWAKFDKSLDGRVEVCMERFSRIDLGSRAGMARKEGL
ncbi:hypothetical protein C8Q78DRAFT_1065988 [Trametes maxima]|nr:hypothetical protein C8Q78DRAFT_1065988 [Trametes maxima]